MRARAMAAALGALILAACGPGGEFAGLSAEGGLEAAGDKADPARAAPVAAPSAQRPDPTRPAATPAPAGQATASRADYRLVAQDVLDVSIYQVPDLNRTVQVDGAGMISLPLIGGVPAAGRTVREVEADVTRRLGARYLQSPQVSVFIRDAVGLRVTVDGAVRKPGFVQMKGATTLLSVIAEAQGFTDTADQSGVMIFRPTEQGRTVARFDVAAIRDGRAVDPPVFGGDTVVVDESSARTAWKQFREALPVAGLFRLF
jgi:polysaccharide export outer membrane protein